MHLGPGLHTYIHTYTASRTNHGPNASPTEASKLRGLVGKMMIQATVTVVGPDRGTVFVMISSYLGGGFTYFLNFTLTWEDDPI